MRTPRRGRRAAASRGPGSRRGRAAPSGSLPRCPTIPTDPADLVLTGGRAAHHGPGEPAVRDALAVRDGRIVAVGSDADVRGHVGPRTRRDRAERRDRPAGLRRLPLPPDARRPEPSTSATSMACPGSMPTWLPPSRYAAEQTPRREWITGGGWSLADFPGGRPAPRGAGRHPPRSARLAPTATATTAWVNRPRARTGRHRRGTRRTRPTAGSRATLTGRQRHAARGRDGARLAPRPAAVEAELRRPIS